MENSAFGEFCDFQHHVKDQNFNFCIYDNHLQTNFRILIIMLKG